MALFNKRTARRRRRDISPAKNARHSSSFFRDIRESGLWFVVGILLLLGTAVGVLDARHWNSQLEEAIIAESNAVLIDLFLLGVVIALYEYRRRRHEELHHLERELESIRMWNEPQGLIRKAEIVAEMCARGLKPLRLRSHNLSESSFNGIDLSDVDLSLVSFANSNLVRTNFRRAHLTSTDFSGACAVEADFREARLSEANFSGAHLSGADFSGADVRNADFRGAKELTGTQLMSSTNWETAHRDSDLACGAPIPTAEKKPLGVQIRERLRGKANPHAPYRLVTEKRVNGSSFTTAVREDDL